MNRQQYLLIKVADDQFDDIAKAMGTSREALPYAERALDIYSEGYKPSWGLGLFPDKISYGDDPAMNSLYIGSAVNAPARNKRKGLLHSLLWNTVPGFANTTRLLEDVNDAKTSWKMLEDNLGKDEEGKRMLGLMGDLRDKSVRDYLKNSAIENGIPAALGIGGVAAGVAHAGIKNKRDEKEYNELINSEGFKQLPKHLQDAILNSKEWKKKRRGWFGKLLRRLKYGVGYGVAAEAPAMAAMWIRNMRNNPKGTAAVKRNVSGYFDTAKRYMNQLKGYLSNKKK